ncbi:MAG: carboxypeptidase regulatory-like domain-containing protein [Bryobacterales bacterium]|nr:carboxypeptidase regulatory-like domain-containing protein [Bryobacterales bacterium]
MNKPLRCVLILLAGANTFYGQRITATLLGDVTDASGAVVAAASVTARNIDTNVERAAQTDEHGAYRLDFVPAGRYNVTIEHSGFRRRTFNGVVLSVDQTVRVDAKLEVGEVVQEVSVQAAAPLLQTDSSAVSSVIERRQVQDLPLNGRQFLQLALLVPGAVPAPPGSRQASERGTASSAININGNREGSNLFLIDGTLNTDPNFNTFVISPNVDSIQEFRVETNSYSPEFGQQAGGQINLITRGGANSYHGSAFEFLRNSALDAKNLFDRPAPAKIPPFRQNQFGTTFGGRIFKDKTFFFTAYEGFRMVRAQTATAVVPDNDLRAGNFANRRNAAGQLTPIYDPSTTRLNPAFNSALPSSPANPQYLRDPFPGNVIPTGRIDPIAKGILGYVDAPNLEALPLGLARFLNNEAVRQNSDQFSARIDHMLSSKDQIFGRYSFSDEALYAPGALTSQATRREPRPQIFTLGHTHTFSPTMTNDARLGFTRLRLYIVNKNAFTENIPAKLGIRGQEQLQASAWEVPNVAFSNDGISTIGGANFGVPTVTRNNTYQFQDTLAIIRGSHTFRAGFQYAHYQLNNATLNYILPSYGLRATPLTADVSNPVGITRGSEFADFLLGISHSNQVTAGSGQVYLRRDILAPWFEDSWRVARSLTLTLGIRWDYISPMTEKLDHIASVYVPNLNGPARPIPIQANVNVQGYGQVPRGLFAKDLTNWAPRVGFAYRVGGADKMVVRGGYGMFYDAQIGNTTVDLVRNPPFQTRLVADLPDSLFPYLSLRDLMPPGAPITSSYFAMGQEEKGKLVYPTAYVQQWNASVQREVVPNWAVTLGYVGSTGRHLSFSGIANIPYPGPGALNPRRPFDPQVNVIFQYAQPRVNSYYNALQFKSEHRAFHGLTMINSYTWSKSIDTGTEIRAGGTAQQTINNWNLDGENRGRSTFDARQRFVSSAIYEIPFGPGRKFGNTKNALTYIAGGWQINGILSLQTGLPFTVYSGVDTANSGVGSVIRPDAVIGVDPKPASQTADAWFNPAAYRLAPDCRNSAVFATLGNPLACFGNLGRNTFSAPGLVNFDFALLKAIPIAERHTIQFRAEFFNMTNTPALGYPTNNLSSATVGRIFSAGAARQIQFSLRYSF